MLFKFKGFTNQGHEAAGTIEAASHEEAAGKLRSERGLFINTLEPADPAPPPKAATPEPATPPPPAPKARTLDEDLDRGMGVVRLLEGAKLPKKLIDKAREEVVVCLVRKAMLK